MRLWHYKIIPYLPKKMLVSQWRELIAIKRQWERGTLIHPLVSYVKDYDKAYFANYTYDVYQELLKRKIKCRDIYMQEIFLFSGINKKTNNSSFNEHDDDYLTICYFNLKEKHLRGIISKEEWALIDNCYNKIDLGRIQWSNFLLHHL